MMMMIAGRARAFACLSSSPRPWESVLMPLLTNVVSACPLLPVFFLFTFCCWSYFSVCRFCLSNNYSKPYKVLLPFFSFTSPPFLLPFFLYSLLHFVYSFVTYIYPDPACIHDGAALACVLAISEMRSS